MGTNYIAPTWRMPENTNNTPVDKLSDYSIDTELNNLLSVGINCGSMADLFGTASVTYNTSYSIWVKPEFAYNTGTYQTFFGNFASGNNAVLLYYQIVDDKWRFLVGDGAGFQFIESAAITSDGELGRGEWQHHCVVFDTINNNAYYYINNQQVNTGTSITKKIATNGDFYIGKKWDLAGGRWAGYLSQACIFDYALSTGQRTDLYNLNNPMAISGADPIAYWPLGDNANLTTTAGYPNISVGADSVFSFNSNNIDLGLESNFSLGGTSKYSTSLWFKKDSNGSSCLWGYNYGDANGSGYYFWLNAGALRIAVGKDGETTGFGYFQIAAIDLPIGEWQNVVVVFDGTLTSGDDRIKVYHNGAAAVGSYVNGSSFPATLPTGNGASNRNIYLGQLQLGNGSFSYSFTGEMSNVQQWDTDLDLSDSVVIYNNGQPLMTGTQPKEANLGAWYKLNQSANWEADTVGNWQIPNAVSSYPQSFNFDTQDYIQYPYVSLPGAFTVSTWAKTTDTTTYGNLLSNSNQWSGGGNLNRNWVLTRWNRTARFIAYNSSGTVIFNNDLGATGQGVNTGQSSSDPSLYNGEWNHILAIWDGTTNTGGIKVFVNGVLEGLGTASTTAINTDSSVPITAGSADTNFEFIGEQSNQQIWNTALTYGSASTKGDVAGGEVATLYNNGNPLTTTIASSNIKAWYKLDNTELFDGANWSIQNQKYPANWKSSLDFTNGTSVDVSSPTYPTIPHFGKEKDISLSVWIRTTESGTVYVNRYPVGFYGPYGNDDMFKFKNGYPSNATLMNLNSLNNKYSEAKVNDGKWHHYVMTYNYSSGDVKYYIDGSIAIDNTGAEMTTTLAPNAGRYFRLTLGRYSTWVGQVSNLVMFDGKELTSTEVNTLYNNGTPELIPSFSPTNWWKLTNTTTGIQDSIGSDNAANNGTTKSNNFVSAEAVTSSGMTESNLVNNNVSTLNGESSGMDSTNLVQSNLTRTQPFSSYSAQFDGLDYFYTLNNAPTLTNVSLSAWIKRNGNQSGYNGICGARDNGGAPHYGISYDMNFSASGNKVLFRVSDGSTTYVNVESNDAVPDATWTHVAGTYDGSNVYIYINGVKQTDTAAFTGALKTPTQAFTIGIQSTSYSTQYLFNGALSNISVFNAGLLEDDILNLYNNGVPQDLSNFRITPTAWYPMDQSYTYFNGSVLVARDVISANDGTGVNLIQENIVGNASGSNSSGIGANFTIEDLKGEMKNSSRNAYSINMADYADGVTNPANSGRSTNVP